MNADNIDYVLGCSKGNKIKFIFKLNIYNHLNRITKSISFNYFRYLI